MKNANEAAASAAMGQTLPPELFSGLLAIAADAIIAVDDAQRIIFFNEGAERIFGWTAAEIGGQSLGVLMPNRFQNGHGDHVRGFGEAHGRARVMSERLPIRGLRKSGEEFPAEATIERIEVDGRNVYATVLRDISVRTAAEAERARLLVDAQAARAEAEDARRSADEANRAKGAFLAVMSHELRTPLNAIGGYAELIELGLRGPVTAQQTADLHRIQQSQRHLVALISQVLTYTRVDAGGMRYDLAAILVCEALVEAEALIEPQARARGLTGVFDACDPRLCVRADREKLQQILLNLLANAVKFTGDGGRFHVAGIARDATVAFAVADTGIGIPADKLHVVFEPFVQVDSSYTRSNDGVGLGLAISRELARGMGGDLTAESTPGVGSTFTLTLPAA